jgi:PAS domain S-box-containing protein
MTVVSHTEQAWFTISLILLTTLMAASSGMAISARRKLARQSAKSLDLSAQRYQQIVESAQEGIATIDHRGVCTLANEEFVRMMALPASAILNKHYTEWVDPALHEMAHGLFARKQQGFSDQFEAEVPTPAGVRYFAIHEKPMPSPDGRFVGYLLTLVDLTDRKRAEDSIRRSEANYRLLFESSPNAGLLVDRETFQIYNANPAASQMFGYTHEEFLAITTLTLQMPERIEPSSLSPGPMHRQYRKKDGTVIEVFVYSHDQEFDGRLCRHLLVIDQTEQVRAANKLRESEQTLALAQEIAQIGSLQVRLPKAPGEQPVRIWSDQLCRLFGVEPEEAARRNLGILDFVHPDDAPSFEDVREVIFGKGTPIGGEHRIVRKDGTVRWVRSTGRKLAGAERTLIATVQDTTEIRALQKQVEQAQRLDSIGRLAGGVAHDFNNLLTVINGYSKLLLKKLDPASQFYGDVQQIAEAGQEAAELTRRLLAFGRKQVMKPVALDLNQVIADSATLLKSVAGEEIHLQMRLSPEPAKVRADVVQMNQVLVNLITNGRSATPGGGTITIETAHAKPGAHVRLSVVDTGSGMDAVTLNRIFEPFFTTKYRTGGTGLGLATVYGIVKQSGGSIQVESEPGKGTRFDIFLPALVNDDAPEVPSSVSAPVVREGCGLIFLVEDQDDVRKFITGILTDGGYRVIAASNGTEALAKFESVRDDVRLLLTDIVMPGMSGYELIERIRAIKSVPALCMSGYEDGRELPETSRQGVILLEKPFSPEGLLEHVRKTIEGLELSY